MPCCATSAILRCYGVGQHLQAGGGRGGRAAQQAVHDIEQLLHALVGANLLPTLE